MGGRGSGSYTAGGASAGGMLAGGEGEDLNIAGWTAQAGHREVDRAVTIKGVEDRIRNLDHEQMAIIGPDGYVLAAVDGGEHSVSLTANSMKYVKGNAVYHNHPNGGTLSPADIITTGNTGAGSISAVSKRFNKTYTLTANKNADGKGLAKAMQKSEKKLEAQWQTKLDSMIGKHYKDKASYERQAYQHWNNIMGDWLTKNASKYGYTYTIE